MNDVVNAYLTGFCHAGGSVRGEYAKKCLINFMKTNHETEMTLEEAKDAIVRFVGN